MDIAGTSKEIATFRSAVNHAYAKSAQVRNAEAKFHSIVDQACKRLKVHDRNNKVNQVVGSLLGLGAVAAAIPTGGATLFLTSCVDAVKTAADSTHMEKASKHWNIARTAIEEHHGAREEFLDSLIGVEMAKDVLCQKYPQLKPFSCVVLWVTLTRCEGTGWTIQDIVMFAAKNCTVGASAIPYPKPTPQMITELALQVRNTSLDLAVAGGSSYLAAVQDFEAATQELVYVGMVVQSAKFGMAAKALGTPSIDVIQLRKIYEASTYNLNALRVHLDQYS
jgi:hypothetical protein